MSIKSENCAPITEDDLSTLCGLSRAIEVCSDVIMGLIDEKTARDALPTLVELHRVELEKLFSHADQSKKGGAA